MESLGRSPSAVALLCLLPLAALALAMVSISLVRVVLCLRRGLGADPRPRSCVSGEGPEAPRPLYIAWARSHLAGVVLFKTLNYRGGAPLRGVGEAKAFLAHQQNITPLATKGAQLPVPRTILGGAGARFCGLFGPKHPLGALLKRSILAVYVLGLLAPSVSTLVQPGLTAPLRGAPTERHPNWHETTGRLGPTPPKKEHLAGGKRPAVGRPAPLARDDKVAVFGPWPIAVASYWNSKGFWVAPWFVVWAPQDGWDNLVCPITTLGVVSMLAEDYDLHRAIRAGDPYSIGILG